MRLGAEIDATDKDGSSSVFWATKLDCVEILKVTIYSMKSFTQMLSMNKKLQRFNSQNLCEKSVLLQISLQILCILINSLLTIMLLNFN